jgi:hypothetical protein
MAVLLVVVLVAAGVKVMVALLVPVTVAMTSRFGEEVPNHSHPTYD